MSNKHPVIRSFCQRALRPALLKIVCCSRPFIPITHSFVFDICAYFQTSKIQHSRVESHAVRMQLQVHKPRAFL